MTSTGKLTPDGKEWLTCALDPFHDANHAIAGYPDTDMSKTIVSVRDFQTTVSRPAAVAEGSNWDCHIFNLPILGADSFCACTTTDYKKITYPADSSYLFSTLNIFSGAAGSTMWPTATSPITANAYLPTASISDLEAGSARVVALGWEVTNTTAVLNKQGAVTVYTIPQAKSSHFWDWLDTPDSVQGSLYAERLRAPAQTVSEAQLLRGTRTWDAAAGVYVVNTQSTVTNPIVGLGNPQLAFDPNSGPTGETCYLMTTAGEAQKSPATALDPSAMSAPLVKTIPYNTTGAFFTGLSSETTLTVRLRVYLEQAPSPLSEPALSVLATPSAGYDVNALELYAQVMSILPCGVRVEDNASGDWWRSVLKVIKHVSPYVGAALTPWLPGAGIVGSAVQKLAGALGDASGDSSSKASSSVSQVDTTLRNKPRFAPRVRSSTRGAAKSGQRRK